MEVEEALTGKREIMAQQGAEESANGMKKHHRGNVGDAQSTKKAKENRGSNYLVECNI